LVCDVLLWLLLISAPLYLLLLLLLLPLKFYFFRQNTQQLTHQISINFFYNKKKSTKNTKLHNTAKFIFVLNNPLLYFSCPAISYYWLFFYLVSAASPLAATWQDHRATWSPWNPHKRQYILQHQSPRMYHPTSLTTINNNQFNIITKTPIQPIRPVWEGMRPKDVEKNYISPSQKSPKVRMPKYLSLTNVDSCYFNNKKHDNADLLSLPECTISTVSTPPSKTWYWV
jgi:hypothetical protein